MAKVLFYHLTAAPLESALPPLLTRARAAGWRIVLRGTDAQRLDWLDQRLWLGDAADFPAHGLAGGPHDDDQPVLLTLATDLPADAGCLIAFDGAPVGRDEAATLQRVCILFDGNDAAALEAARAQWRDVKDWGLPAEYWAQDQGRWIKRAES